MRKLIVAAAVGGALVVAALATSVTAAPGGRVLTVVEHADTDYVVDLGATGDSLGDLLAFGNPIYDAGDNHQIGRDEGSCVRTNPGVAWECMWTTLLDGGSLTVEGPFTDDGADSVLAITGGTGAYANVRGEMTLHWRNELGTQFDFSYRMNG